MKKTFFAFLVVNVIGVGLAAVMVVGFRATDGVTASEAPAPQPQVVATPAPEQATGAIITGWRVRDTPENPKAALGGFTLVLDVLIGGLGELKGFEVEVVLPFNQTAVEWNQTLLNNIQIEAQLRGIDLPRTNVLLPGFGKGF